MEYLESPSALRESGPPLPVLMSADTIADV